MFVDEVRAAVMASPRVGLPALAAALWKSHAAGAIGDDDAQQLAELIEARKAVPVARPAPRRVGSRPRSPASMERRRRWVASGLMPPQVACHFTMGEGAALAVIAAEVARRGLCRFTLGHIAALAGVCKSTVRSAVRQAEALGLVRSEEWRIAAFRSAPNTVTILSAEWTAWLRLVVRRRRPVQPQGGGSKSVEPTSTHLSTEDRRPRNYRGLTRREDSPEQERSVATINRSR